MTIRQGEPAFDNVTGTIAPAVTDIIKIKGMQQHASSCVFYLCAQQSCAIYGHRPLECKALKCWDTGEIEGIYNCQRLTRRHLVSKVKGLWELVEDHQQRCDYAHIAELAAMITQNRCAEENTQALLELIRYDGHLRELTLKRSNLDPELLTFLFGRPLSFTIKLFRLEITRTEKGTVLEPTGQVCYRRNGF